MASPKSLPVYCTTFGHKLELPWVRKRNIYNRDSCLWDENPNPGTKVRPIPKYRTAGAKGRTA
jgi:hypothetical protein